jgi:hypothetical protein
MCNPVGTAWENKLREDVLLIAKLYSLYPRKRKKTSYIVCIHYFAALVSHTPAICFCDYGNTK